MDKRIKLIRPCEWEEVFLTWYKNEGENPNWASLAKERGFASWAEWRLKGYARRFECEKAEWGLYEISDPSAVISDWFGGPFRTWIERHYGGEKTRSFVDLASQPNIIENPTIKAMVIDYPKDTIISALQAKDGRIFIIEGSHRGCALALMVKNNNNFPGKLIFAIGKSALSELPAVGQNTLKR